MSSNPAPKTPLQTVGFVVGLLMAVGSLVTAMVALVTKEAGFSLKTDGQQLLGLGLVIVFVLGIAWAVKTLFRSDVESGIAFFDRNNPPAALPPAAVRDATKRQGEG